MNESKISQSRNSLFSKLKSKISKVSLFHQHFEESPSPNKKIELYSFQAKEIPIINEINESNDSSNRSIITSLQKTPNSNDFSEENTYLLRFLNMKKYEITSLFEKINVLERKNQELQHSLQGFEIDSHGLNEIKWFQTPSNKKLFNDDHKSKNNNDDNLKEKNEDLKEKCINSQILYQNFLKNKPISVNFHDFQLNIYNGKKLHKLGGLIEMRIEIKPQENKKISDHPLDYFNFYEIIFESTTMK